MNEEKNKTYETRELTLAATLMTVGFELVGIDYQIEKDSRPVGYFRFENNKDLGIAIKQFWAAKLAVEPREFSNNIRSLRSQVNCEYKSPHSQFAKIN